jgi:hypothetical protein
MRNAPRTEERIRLYAIMLALALALLLMPLAGCQVPLR